MINQNLIMTDELESLLSSVLSKIMTQVDPADDRDYCTDSIDRLITEAGNTMRTQAAIITCWAFSNRSN